MAEEYLGGSALGHPNPKPQPQPRPGVACALSVCKRRLLLDAQRDRELLAPPSSSQRATEPLLQAEADRDGARCSATGPLPPGREDGKGGAAREYLLWRDKPGGAAATPTGAA